MASSVENKGLDKIYETICQCRDTFESSGYLSKLHEQQSLYWTWQTVDDLLSKRIRSSPAVSSLLEKGSELHKGLLQGTSTPRAAAETLIDIFIQKYKYTTHKLE